MNNKLKTSCDSINRDAERLKELSDSIPALIKELEAGLNRLNGCWEGSAWNAYQNTNTYYMEVLEEVYKYYGEFTANLHTAGKEYMKAEQDVMDEVDSWFL